MPKGWGLRAGICYMLICINLNEITWLHCISLSCAEPEHALLQSLTIPSHNALELGNNKKKTLKNVLQNVSDQLLISFC